LREIAYAKCGIRGMPPVTTTVTLEVKHQPSHSYGTSLGGVTVAIDKLLDMQGQTHGRYQWYLISFEDNPAATSHRYYARLEKYERWA
jgi:hypothetical protein